jgi:exonuclease III
LEGLRIRRPGIPVILTGDLNVAHTHLDYYNPTDVRTKKQAGTTPEEQLSFQTNFINSLGLVDTFRAHFPLEKNYSYFSARKGQAGRDRREGMRIDYFLTDVPADQLLQYPPEFVPFIEEKVRVVAL